MRSAALLLLLAAPLRAQDAKVETQLLLAPEPGARFEISPKGLHVAAVVLRGSRQVLAYDGADGPKFDQVLSLSAQTSGGGRVVWSDDGARYAYHAKLGQEYVVLVDGKEVARGPWSPDLQAQGETPVNDLGFSPGGKHWYVIIQTRTTGRQHFQMILDGVAGPVAEDYIRPLWSPDGEHHTYIQKIATATMTEPRYVLIVDAKPAPYLAGDMQWTGDSKHLITQRKLPGANMEVLADGQPIMRVPGGAAFTMAPVGPGMLGVAAAEFPGGTRGTFLLVGTRKAVGSECTSTGGLDGIYMSADAKHYAARCAMSFMYVDGKKGQEYPEGLSNLLFTADGRPVYYGRTNQRVFMVIGEQESNAYTWIQDVPGVTREEQRAAAAHPAPAVVRGNHVAYIARTNPNDGMATVVVVDGKAIPAQAASMVSLSPDGARFAFLSGRQGSSVTVDGTPYASGGVDPGIGNVGFQGIIHWSTDSKHVAWITQAPNQGVAIDGRYVAAPGWTRFVHFSADGKHLVWLVRGQGSEHQVYLDGIKVLTIPQNLSLENEADVYWDFPADGSIRLVAQDNAGMKRFTIVPGGSSVEAAAAKGAVIK